VTLGKWKREIIEWVPSLRVFQFYGPAEEKEALCSRLVNTRDFDIVLTTFEMAIKEKAAMKKLNFDFLILDEAQRIKNDQSVLS
jgi:SWI/SNF-related matrix-associated actin-dependent regulator of chromatin subfamily A member 5